jgi:hypothetical protein
MFQVIEGTRRPRLTDLKEAANRGGLLEHDPEQWVPVFPRDKREAFARRSCSNKKMERDDDSKKSHYAPGLFQRAVHGREHPIQICAEAVDCRDNRQRYARRDQAVFNCRSAGFISQEFNNGPLQGMPPYGYVQVMLQPRKSTWCHLRVSKIRL